MVARQVPGGMPNPAQEASLTIELSKIPPPLLSTLKQELGLGDKDNLHFTIEEKVCATHQMSLCVIGTDDLI
jgi:hypothetical protein